MCGALCFSASPEHLHRRATQAAAPTLQYGPTGTLSFIWGCCSHTSASHTAALIEIQM
jgi:hypothetical protein